MIYPIPKYVRPEARRQESLMHINSPFGTRPIVLEVNVRTYVGSLLACVAISIHKIHEVSMHHHHSMHKRFQLAIRCVIRILEIPLLLLLLDPQILLLLTLDLFL